MHDPMTVAFDIRRPWPERSHINMAKTSKPRWRIRHHHTCGDHCGPDRAKHETSNPFPWWRPGSYSAFWTLAGRSWYWPPLITIWHVEPDGHNSGEVCKHYERTQQPDGTWKTRTRHAWRWHAHHWRIQVHPLQQWRRRLLTRCAWCHGRSRKGDAVNVSNGDNSPRAPWWRGETGLHHMGCSSVASAHRTCLCADQIYEPEPGRGTYGHCTRCRKFRAWHTTESRLQRLRILAAIPPGHRDHDAYQQVRELAIAEQAATGD